MEKKHYEVTIAKYSDYSAADPYWINLSYRIDASNVKQAISDALNKYFEKHGPDANEDYAGCCGPLMKYETCKAALEYAFKKCGKKIVGFIDNIDSLIDGGWSMESDGRENDPVTGELLHTIPINEDSALEEMQYLLDQDKLDKDDWVWLDFACNSFCNQNGEINSMLRRITRKHR